jgi:hypothetical protein
MNVSWTRAPAKHFEWVHGRIRCGTCAPRFRDVVLTGAIVCWTTEPPAPPGRPPPSPPPPLTIDHAVEEGLHALVEALIAGLAVGRLHVCVQQGGWGWGVQV